jgi:hypothetical protein
MSLIAIVLYLTALDNSTTYHLRVTVLNVQGVPVEDATVWTSVGGEGKDVAGGRQFDIPVDAVPRNSRVTVYAVKKADFLTGHTELTLDTDFNPTVTVQLTRDTTARVGGQVLDDQDRLITGARVFVDGHEAEAVTTGPDARFEVAAHAAMDQPVRLHAEKTGVGTATLWHPAGDMHVELRLQR